MNEKTVGILGGMGPEATAELFYRIIKATPAKKDQDHLSIIIYNDPKIPDRTEAILKGKCSPLPKLVEIARNLEKAGADFIVIPCNTAHYYYKELKKKVGVPILNMIELTAMTINEKYPNTRKVGVIATTGTVKVRMYDKVFKKMGIKVVYPSAKLQEKVMEGIYAIKAGRIKRGKRILLKILQYLTQKGCRTVISACTEASLVLNKVAKQSITIIDPLQILAEVTVAVALNKCEVKIANLLSHSNKIL